jgi:UDPglucose 6-dehydrogenase
VLIRRLNEAGAEIRVHDPKATANVRDIFGPRLTYCDRAYGTVEGADVLAIVTEWQEFRNPDFEVIRRLLRQPNIVDGRNLYDPPNMASMGFTYSSIGRSTVRPSSPREGHAT